MKPPSPALREDRALLVSPPADQDRGRPRCLALFQTDGVVTLRHARGAKGYPFDLQIP